MKKEVELKNFTWSEFSKELDKLFVFDNVIEEPALFGTSLPYDFLSDLGAYSSLSEYLGEEVGFYAVSIDNNFKDNLYLSVINYVENTYFTFGKRQFQDCDLSNDTFKLSIKNGEVVKETRHFVNDLNSALKALGADYEVREHLPRCGNFRYVILKGDTLIKKLTIGDIISLDLSKVPSLIKHYTCL